jgi:hypothetical protein
MIPLKEKKVEKLSTPFHPHLWGPNKIKHLLLLLYQMGHNICKKGSRPFFTVYQFSVATLS